MDISTAVFTHGSFNFMSADQSAHESARGGRGKGKTFVRDPQFGVPQVLNCLSCIN